MPSDVHSSYYKLQASHPPYYQSDSIKIRRITNIMQVEHVTSEVATRILYKECDLHFLSNLTYLVSQICIKYFSSATMT